MTTKLPPIEGRLRTRCAKCGYEFYIGMSLAMKMGINTGHCSCGACGTFLHAEILEGDEMWTEEFDKFLERTKGTA